MREIAFEAWGGAKQSLIALLQFFEEAHPRAVITIEGLSPVKWGVEMARMNDPFSHRCRVTINEGE